MQVAPPSETEAKGRKQQPNSAEWSMNGGGSFIHLIQSSIFLYKLSNNLPFIFNFIHCTFI